MNLPCHRATPQRKAGGPGSRGGTSRPTAGNPVATPSVDMAELETLRTVNATMKEELEGLYMQLKELRGQQRPVETIGLKPPVRTYASPPEPLTMAESTRRINAELAARKNNAKMPWEGG